MSTILILRSRNSVKQPVPLFLSSGRQYSVKIVNNVYNFNYNFNFEISKQGLTACATLSSLLPNQTESSSLVSILLTATIARSISLLSLELSRLRPCSKYRGVNFSSFLWRLPNICLG